MISLPQLELLIRHTRIIFDFYAYSKKPITYLANYLTQSDLRRLKLRLKHVVRLRREFVELSSSHQVAQATTVRIQESAWRAR